MNLRVPTRGGSLSRAAEQGCDRVSAVLSLLWPEPCTIRWSRERDHDGVPYAIVPSCAAPVVIAPRRPRRAMAARIRGYNTAMHGRSRVKAQLAALAASTGVTDCLVPCAWIDDSAAGPDTSIRKHLMQLLGHDVNLSISIGPPRAVQKPVIQVAHGSGIPMAFAKIGHTCTTGDLVVHEAAKLRHVGARLQSQHEVEVPAVISSGSWRGMPVLVQSALRAGHSPTRDQVTATIRVISAMDGVGRAPLESSPYLAALRDRVSSLPNTAATSAIRSTMAAFPRTGVEIAFGSWHGDLTPWNLTASDGTVRVWDWEHYAAGVPIGFDLLHHDAHRAASRRGANPAEAMGQALARAPGELAALGVPPAAARWVALLYAVDIATRYARDHEEEGETRLGSLAWFEPTAQRQLSALDRDL